MFFTEDYTQLFNPVLIPTDYMSFDDKLNTIVRLVIFVFLILALIFNDSRLILMMLILILIIINIYYYNKKNITISEKYLNEKEYKIINNEICTKPTKNNPFMNPNILNITYNPNEKNIKNCDIDNEEVNKNINDLFNENTYRNVNDIYDRTSLKRQFYTMPSTTFPNDREKYSEWLYHRDKSCKENNGEQCYKNIYTSLYYN
jgi:hypothetical protein